jgi:hypothetical protein
MTYLKRLKNHPGKGMATLMTLFGGLAGASNENSPIIAGFIAGSLALGALCWGIVLWTARTQPCGGGES